MTPDTENTINILTLEIAHLNERVQWLEHAVFPKKKEDAELDYLEVRKALWDKMNGVVVGNAQHICMKCRTRTVSDNQGQCDACRGNIS